ncbi:MAG: hypothetical protein JET69_03115 [Methanomassiliicoccales archaeon]|nr:hypothetical protein [Methanomassiliicoccales archaeon]
MTDRTSDRGLSEGEMNRIAAQIIGEWYTMATEHLAATTGPEKAVEIMGPCFFTKGLEIWEKGSKIAQLEGDSAWLIAQDLKIANMVPGPPGVVEIAERGVITTYAECFALGSKYVPAYCQIHEIALRAQVKGIDPGWDFHFTRTMPQGFDCCIGVARKTPVPLDRWEDSGTVVAVMLDFEVVDAVKKFMIWAVRVWWVLIVASLVYAVGEEKAIEILRPSMVENGKVWGLKLAEMLGVERNETGLAKLLETFSDIMEVRGEITICPERIDEFVISCPFSGSSEGVCRLFHSFIEGLCYSMDPSLTFCNKRLESSEHICRWRIKEGVGAVENVQLPMQD